MATLIEFGGALIIAVASVRALIALFVGQGIAMARFLMISGSLNALGFKTAATLLKVIQLGTWQGIGIFAAVLTLRTLIKHLSIWELAQLPRARFSGLQS